METLVKEYRLAALVLSAIVAGCTFPMGGTAPKTPSDAVIEIPPSRWEPQYVATFEDDYTTENATSTIENLGFELTSSHTDHVTGRRASDGETLEIRTLSGVRGLAVVMTAPQVPRDAETPDGPTACQRAQSTFDELLRDVVRATAWTARKTGPCEAFLVSG